MYDDEALAIFRGINSCLLIAEQFGIFLKHRLFFFCGFFFNSGEVFIIGRILTIFLRHIYVSDIAYLYEDRVIESFTRKVLSYQGLITTSLASLLENFDLKFST